MAILVIAKDVDIRLATMRTLQEAGFLVTGGGTGAEATGLARRFHPALVLLDAVLPDASGVDIAEELQRDPCLAGTFVVLVYATQAELRARTAAAGESVTGGRMARPRSKTELLTQIETFLRIHAGQEALRASEERFKRVFQHSPAGMALVSPDLRFLEANPAFRSMLGYADSELAGKTFQDVTFPEDRSAGAELANWILSGKTDVFHFEKRYLRKDGSAVWGLVSATPIRDNQRKPAYFVIQIVDITEHKQAQEALRQSEEKHRTVLQTAMDGFVRVGLEGRLLEVNAAYCRMTGYSAEELLAMRVSDLESIETADDSAAHIQRITALGEDRFESRHRRKDGSTIDVEVSVQYRPTDGDIVAFLRDITKRKQAEEALRTSERRLREAQKVGHTGYLDWDIRTNEMVWSDETCRICGCEPACCKLTLASMMALIPAEDREFVERELAGALRGDSDLDIEHRMTRPDGQVIHVHACGKVTRDAEGRPLRMLGTIADITERKRHEEERERLRLQLAQAQKLESIGRLAGGVAHDFNNLLTVINGYAEFLAGALAGGSRLRQYALEIGRAGERAASLTGQLLAFSRKQAIAPKAIDLNSVVTDSERMLKRLIGEDIELATNLAPRLGLVMADPDQIHQVIMNLAVNARDAMPDGGRIEITTAEIDLDEDAAALYADAVPGRYLQLTVADTGTGMTEEVQRKLFEPFFTTKAPGKGTGLGLATVYGIVRQSGGWIEVESEVGRGSVFRIHVPRLEGSEASDEAGPAAARSAGEVETVLLVEDQDSVRRLAKTVLEKLGYRVLEAASGAEALAIARGCSIDLLLTDVVMPGMDGHALSQQLRDSRPNLRVMLMSGYAGDVITPRDAVGSGLGYIQKPFTADELAARVRATLDLRV